MAEKRPRELIGVTENCTQKKPSIEIPLERGSGAQGRTSISQQKSESCEEQSSVSNGHWRKPTTIKELAANINEVANGVLNGTVDLRTAQVYGALVRVVAQATSLEVTRGRFLKEMPDLGLELEECE